MMSAIADAGLAPPGAETDYSRWLLGQGHDKGAIDFADRALSRSSGDPEALSLRSAAKLRTGDFPGPNFLAQKKGLHFERPGLSPG